MVDNPYVLNVRDDQFEAEVLERSMSLPVLVDFWAPWCAPCRQLAPLLETLAQEYEGKFILAKVNVDENPITASQFRVSGIPHVLAMVEKRIAGQFQGLLHPDELRRFLDQLIPSELDLLVRQAAEIEGNDPSGAAERYEQVVAKDARHSLALSGLAACSLRQGDWQRAETLARQVPDGTEGWERAINTLAQIEFRRHAEAAGSVEALTAKTENDPADLQTRLDLGLALAGHGKWTEALEQLVTVIERDRDFGAQHAKEPMVRIFEILGQQHEISNRYRSRLASALY